MLKFLIVLFFSATALLPLATAQALDQVGVQADREKLTVAMTREQLDELPEWNG